MKERDFHNLIEQQNPEVKQRIWEKVSAQLNLADTQAQPTVKVKKKTWIWGVAVMAVCLVTLAVVLPIMLGNGGGVRFCSSSQYTEDELGKTLKGYSCEHNNKYLYVDWYDYADDVITKLAHMNDNVNEIVYLKELIYNDDSGEEITLFITDNKTRVDVLERFYVGGQDLSVKNVNVAWRCQDLSVCFAMFEYKGYVYHLQLKGVSGQERVVEIIETMLP